MNTRQQYLAIVGPTGVGKTALGIELARAWGGELISVDSRQVYQGMDVGTGKETAEGEWLLVNQRRTLALEGVLVHGLDLVTPDVAFSVAQWQRVALQLRDEIEARGKIPIFVGGTGLYLDALMGRVPSLVVPPNPVLRAQLTGVKAAELLAQLATLDPERAQGMNASDRQNPVRLIRALELAQYRLEGKSSLGQAISLPACNLFLLGLTRSRAALYAQADTRVARMIDQGLVAEVADIQRRFGEQTQAMTGIGYAEIAAYLTGALSLAEAVRRMQFRTHGYIRRQYTWFRQRPVQWVEVDDPAWLQTAQTLVAPVLSGDGVVQC